MITVLRYLIEKGSSQMIPVLRFLIEGGSSQIITVDYIGGRVVYKNSKSEYVILEQPLKQLNYYNSLKNNSSLALVNIKFDFT